MRHPRDVVLDAYKANSALDETGEPVCLTGAHPLPDVRVVLNEAGHPLCTAEDPCSPWAMLQTLGMDSEQASAVLLADELAEGVRRRNADPAQREHDDDTDNAELFADQNKHRLRWCPDRGLWLFYMGSHWSEDPGGGAATRLAMGTARSMHLLARNSKHPARQEAMHRRAAAAGNRPRLSAMVELGKALMEVREEELDGDPWLLNVLNGTVDLRSGELYPHRSHHLLSMVAPVEWRDRAWSERWNQFLRTSIPDADERAFLQRLAGYCLAGVATEERFFFVHGPAGSGKSTFVEALAAMLGPYAGTADPSLFLRSQRPTDAHQANPALVHLVHRRLAVSAEPPRGRSFDEGFLKRLTGGDRLATRQNYGRTFEFTPQFTLLIVGNSRPPVEDDSGGAMSRRYVEVPFPVPVGDRRDDSLKVELKDPARSGSAILAWAVEGCLEWQRRGLDPPEVVRAASADYWAEQQENDPVLSFLNEHYERTDDPADVVPGGKLSSHFAAVSGERISAKALVRRMEEMGLSRRKTQGVLVWQGLRRQQLLEAPTWGELVELRPRGGQG